MVINVFLAMELVALPPLNILIDMTRSGFLLVARRK